MDESQLSRAIDKEIRAFQRETGRKSAPSVKDLLRASQNEQFKQNLNSAAEYWRLQNATTRGPSIAQVKKMLLKSEKPTGLAKQDQGNPAVTQEYVDLFDVWAGSQGEIRGYIDRLAGDQRVSAPVLASIVAEVTGKRIKMPSLKAAQSALAAEFANRNVTRLAKAAAGSSKPL